jgi:type III restriction enzyme
VIEVRPEVENRLFGTAPGTTGQQQPGLFEKPREQEVARAALQAIQYFERLPRSTDLRTPEVQQQIIERVTLAIRPVQTELPGIAEQVDIAKVVAQTVETHIQMTIDIPRVFVEPKGEVICRYNDFDLDLAGVRLQPVAADILIQHLHDHAQYRLLSGSGVVDEERLEDYLVRGLIEFNDISYDDHSDLLYELCGQVVQHLRSYLGNDDEVRNVLQYHARTLVNLIHAQMQDHYEEVAVGYQAHVSKGFHTLSTTAYSIPDGEQPRYFRTPVEERLLIRGMVFGGFTKCLYAAQKFDSDAERRFAVVLENDQDVQKWFKPGKDVLKIQYDYDSAYEPDFVVETATAKYLCEAKRASEMTDQEVLSKAEAAATWCQYATDHAKQNGGKPWHYLLIPHDTIQDNKTLQGLAAAYTYVPKPAGAAADVQPA